MQFNEIIEKGKQVKATIAVCKSNDESVIKSVVKAIKETNVNFILFDEEPQDELIRSFNLSATEFKRIHIVQTRDEQHTVSECVNSVTTGEADLIMKGIISTSTLLKEILNDKYQLKTSNRMSHVALFNVPEYHKMLAISDVAMNIAPNTEEKIEITSNLIDTLHILGIEKPNIAVLSAIENVNPKMQSSVDAHAVVSHFKNMSTDVMIEGPIAFDAAINKQASIIKNIDSNISGNVDGLIVPQIESGNILYKSLVYLSHADVASIIIGAKIPIILTSRSDNSRDKFHSICSALMLI
ncbi:phosphate acyltransferase [Mammaliicoccus sp. Dog046]|uniref:phosphate acyltransferase n=1 Tax=Mammaliicoccus sp. Dog046 TaxID=3034233 RepID=UPI002B25FAFC|nr:phosphate acyltransferase [Mammaliicoccus sp. Dog046]WQK86647.1 phosphate acyltransferase [Mammaliicoccus sp. Dog046]